MTVAELLGRLHGMPAAAQVIVKSSACVTVEEIEDNPESEYFEYDEVYDVEAVEGEVVIYADVRTRDDDRLWGE